MKIVIDTSILIDHLRGGNVWNNLSDRVEEANIELFIPTIVIFELYSGKSSKSPLMKEKIEKAISKFYRIDLTEEIARKAGEIYRDFSPNIQIPDYIIAASALDIGAEVVTLNNKHFAQIPGLSLYKI